MLMLFISLYPVFFPLLSCLPDTFCSEHCLWKLALAMYAYPLERGVASAIDKLEYLAYVCCCVTSGPFEKNSNFTAYLGSNKQMSANQLTSNGVAL